MNIETTKVSITHESPQLSGIICYAHLYHADCFDIMPKIESKSIDLILADLPYGTTACKWDSVLPFDKLWNEYERLITDNGAIVLFGSQPFTSALIMSNAKLFKYEIIWEKPNPSNPLLAKKQTLKNHENICIFYKKQCVFNPQMVTRRQEDKRKQKIKTLGIFKTTGQKRIIPSGDFELKLPMSVQFFDREQSGFHPTQKPIELLKYLIKTYTNEFTTCKECAGSGEIFAGFNQMDCDLKTCPTCKGEGKTRSVILDNTMGSGSTGVAAKMLQRNFIGIEKELNYFEIAQKRIDNTIIETSIFDCA
jgi:DNA modification methylase